MTHHPPIGMLLKYQMFTQDLEGKEDLLLCFDDCHEDKDRDKDYEMKTEAGLCIVSKACHKHTILGLVEEHSC
jgi:hypothetical protein